LKFHNKNCDLFHCRYWNG